MTVSLRSLQAKAHRCRGPKPFRALLTDLHELIPYSHFCGHWGYPKESKTRYIFNEGFPLDLIRWRLTTGALWRSPLFQRWLKTDRVFLWSDAVKDAPVDPALQTRMEKAGVQHSLCGGLTSQNYFVIFAASMPSAERARAYIETFEAVLPALVEASQRAFPRDLLTKRETAILERRAFGEITKQIAAAEHISERMVRQHLGTIKRKLFTDDLANAVAIAVKNGVIFQPSE